MKIQLYAYWLLLFSVMFIVLHANKYANTVGATTSMKLTGYQFMYVSFTQTSIQTHQKLDLTKENKLFRDNNNL